MIELGDVDSVGSAEEFRSNYGTVVRDLIALAGREAVGQSRPIRGKIAQSGHQIAARQKVSAGCPTMASRWQKSLPPVAGS